MKIYTNNLININNKFKKRIPYLSLLIIKLGIIMRFYYLSIIGYILYLTLNSNDNYLLYLYKVITKKNKPYFILLKKTGFNKDAEIINKKLEKDLVFFMSDIFLGSALKGGLNSICILFYLQRLCNKLSQTPSTIFS